MKTVFLGKIIKERRMELGLTQEQLCEGICEPATLSRFENGKLTPSYGRIRALFSRLGLPEHRYYAVLSKHEQEVDRLQDEISALEDVLRSANLDERSRDRERQRLLELVGELEGAMDEDDQFSRQFVLISKILLRLPKEDDPNPEERREMLLEAIRMTVPSFDESNISAGLYGPQELRLLNMLALHYATCRQEERSLSLYDQLVRYVQEHRQIIRQTDTALTELLFHYAAALARFSHFSKSLEIAQQARENCLQYQHHLYLPWIAYLLAACSFYLGRREQACCHCRQAYYGLKLSGCERMASLVREKARCCWQLELED